MVSREPVYPYPSFHGCNGDTVPKAQALLGAEGMGGDKVGRGCHRPVAHGHIQPSLVFGADAPTHTPVLGLQGLGIRLFGHGCWSV